MRGAVEGGHLSTVEMLHNHDNGLLNDEGRCGETILQMAILYLRFEIIHFLLDNGANALLITDDESTTLMLSCSFGTYPEIVRRLLAAGVDVDARDICQHTALHIAAKNAFIEVVRELVVEQNANIFALDENGKTPFDLVTGTRYRPAGEIYAFLIEYYGYKLTLEHGRLALHTILDAAEYSNAADQEFHPPLSPLRIRLPLGKLTLNHFSILLRSLDTELIRNRDDSGKLPIHVACQANAPVEVLSMLTEMDTATLQIADYKGALPIHSLCGSLTPAEYASARFLVERGGVGTVAARNLDGALPLHLLCGSTNPCLRTVQYLIQSFPASVAVQTNSGQYPLMFAARDTSEASLSIVYELVRANPHVC